MPATYEPIATTTLGSDQSSVSFTSISGSYTDLILVQVFPSAQALSYSSIQFNSDTGSNYSATRLLGYTSALSNRDSNQNYITFGSTSYMANGNIITHIMNYANTNTYKTILSRCNFDATETSAEVGLWRSTSAITSLTLTKRVGGDLETGSTFTLYGIKAA